MQILALLLVTVFAASAGAADSPKPRDDVAQMIMIMDGPRGKECTERKIVKTEVVEAARDKTPAVERWTLDRCGKSVNYIVKYSKGGKTFDVQLEK
ncbi:MAG TPA: hypothetical protein VGH50_08060 [Candidatus Binatia bacterium]|jgi:hypothetical protein